ncbi:MAG: cellulase family glycosylhydrolase [Planctomycetes bacterium]|nr:cellulase family glycosylhydrolase [Planctomycetota bacterium]
MRRATLATLTLLLAGSLPAALAEDLSGTYALRGLAGLRGVRVELTLEPVGPDRYRATRTVRQGKAEATLHGEALWTEGRLDLRLDAAPGLSGRLLGGGGPVAYHGSYRARGRWLIGSVRAPRPDGKLVTSREAGKRARELTPPEAAEGAAVIRHPHRPGGRLRVAGRALRDPSGRAVLLRGVNVGLKRAPFLAPHTDADVQRLVARTGINYVRYYVAWRALEPEPLRYDASYVASVLEGIRRWTRAGVYVCVDFHQDVWGGPFTAHGAPEWASLGKQSGFTLPAGLPWQARYVEPRVYRQFEAFWANQKVPASGLGVQEHYARAWAFLAARLQGDDLVVGYDPMNEPFMGKEIQGALLRAGLGTSGTVLRAALGGGVRALFSPARFGEAFEERMTTLLRDPKRFDATIRRLEPASKAFEQRLSAFYTRVGKAIRAVDPGRPLFVEPFALGGIGLPSHLPRPDLDQLVYAPHLYDSFMDSGFPYDGDASRVTRALERHVATAHRLDAPLVVGEWGNLPGDEGAAEYADDVGDLFDRYGVGAAYWDHVPGSAGTPWGEVANGEAAHEGRLRTSHEDVPLFLVAMRPFAARVAGELVESNYEERTRVLRATVRVDADVHAPSVFVTPRHAYPAGVEVRLSGVAAEWEHDPAAGVVYVWAGGSGALSVELSPQAE